MKEPDHGGSVVPPTLLVTLSLSKGRDGRMDAGVLALHPDGSTKLTMRELGMGDGESRSAEAPSLPSSRQGAQFPFGDEGRPTGSLHRPCRNAQPRRIAAWWAMWWLPGGRRMRHPSDRMRKKGM